MTPLGHLRIQPAAETGCVCMVLLSMRITCTAVSAAATAAAAAAVLVVGLLAFASGDRHPSGGGVT